ncbi:MAG: hypothetical protein KDB86_13680, partial [Actinobacteria bacterium]|nr:hypothetical protein [Actinomycetota bacterium]
MSDKPFWEEWLSAGADFAQLSVSEARRLAERLVRDGQLAADGAQNFAESLVAMSAKRATELREIVTAEVSDQLKSLRGEFDRLEHRVAELTGRAEALLPMRSSGSDPAPAPAAPASSAPSAPTPAPAASQATATKPAARTTPATKASPAASETTATAASETAGTTAPAAAKKTPAKASTAKTTAAKTTAAKKPAAKTTAAKTTA